MSPLIQVSPHSSKEQLYHDLVGGKHQQTMDELQTDPCIETRDSIPSQDLVEAVDDSILLYFGRRELDFAQELSPNGVKRITEW